MKQGPFEKQHQAQWQSFAEQLRKAQGGKVDLPHFAADFRCICQHLALAEERGYSSRLVERLGQLAMAGHQVFYRRGSRFLAGLIAFVLAGFPRLVRREWRLVSIAGGLLFGVLALCTLLFYLYPELIYSLFDPQKIAEMEYLYDPVARRLGRFGERGAGDDWRMFGYYIMHNIGLAFQMFAGGLPLGLGSLAYLIYNGLAMGAIAGHLSHIGSGSTFWPFVVGHAAFELCALAIAGASGLRLGASLLAPGQLSRAEALRQGAKAGVGLISGAALMLVLAAFIEGYWSSSSHISPPVKYLVGTALWALVGAWLLLSGRARHATD